MSYETPTIWQLLNREVSWIQRLRKKCVWACRGLEGLCDAAAAGNASLLDDWSTAIIGSDIEGSGRGTDHIQRSLRRVASAIDAVATPTICFQLALVENRRAGEPLDERVLLTRPSAHAAVIDAHDKLCMELFFTHNKAGKLIPAGGLNCLQRLGLSLDLALVRDLLTDRDGRVLDGEFYRELGDAVLDESRRAVQHMRMQCLATLAAGDRRHGPSAPAPPVRHEPTPATAPRGEPSLLVYPGGGQE